MAEGGIRPCHFWVELAFPPAFAKKQVGGLVALLPLVQRAHGLREVQHEAQGQAGQAVYDEERGDAHGFGQHATDGDAYWGGQPHAAVSRPMARPILSSGTLRWVSVMVGPLNQAQATAITATSR